MIYIKLFRPSDGTHKPCVQIHDKTYDCSFDHIKKLVKELQIDFPYLKDEDIKIQKYGGKRIKGITFAEAFLPQSIPTPQGYTEIKDLEYVL